MSYSVIIHVRKKIHTKQGRARYGVVEKLRHGVLLLACVMFNVESLHSVSIAQRQNQRMSESPPRVRIERDNKARKVSHGIDFWFIRAPPLST